MVISMRTSGTDHRRAFHVGLLIEVTGFALAATLCFALGLRINMSPSLETGLYITTRDHRARLIEFCPPEPYASESKERGYRPAGICPDGAAPLLKPIVAREGDIVRLSPRGISVNGTLLENTTPLSVDGKGRQLTPWGSGVYPVMPGQVWVASLYNPGSYDSRYFGPIHVNSIRRRLRPLWTLNRYAPGAASRFSPSCLQELQG